MSAKKIWGPDGSSCLRSWWQGIPWRVDLGSWCIPCKHAKHNQTCPTIAVLPHDLNLSMWFWDIWESEHVPTSPVAEATLCSLPSPAKNISRQHPEPAAHAYMIIILRYWDTEIISPSLLQSPKAGVPPQRVQDIPIPASCADGVHHVPQIQSYSSLQPCCCVWFRISKSKSCTVQQSNISKPQHEKDTKRSYWMNQVEVAKLQPGLLRFSPSVTMPRTWRAASKSQSDISWKEADSEPQSICTVEPEAWLIIWSSARQCCRTTILI